MAKRRLPLTLLLIALLSVSLLGQSFDLTTALSKFLRDLQSGTLGVNNLITSIVTSGSGTFGSVVSTGTGSFTTISPSTPKVTTGTDDTLVTTGDLTRVRYQATITPATAGVGNCGAAFLAAALTADCTVATLPAGQKLVGVYADVTAGFTCSGTCTGTKVVQCGTAVAGVQVLAAGLSVAAIATFGLADADLGSGMIRAGAIQGGLVGSWSATTPISCRFTSGLGNWGNASATFVNAGSIKFTLVTEQIK